MRMWKFRFPHAASDPATLEGDSWINTTDHVLKFNSNGATMKVYAGNPVENQVSQSVACTFTNTSYDTGSGNVAGVAFVAGPQGKAQITISVVDAAMGAAASGAVSFQVLTGSSVGSGTGVVTSSDDVAIWVKDVTSFGSSITKLVSGLTPGSSYNARIQGRVISGGNTLTVRGNRLNVVPF